MPHNEVACSLKDLPLYILYSAVTFFITVAGDQPECAISENKAYSFQSSPAYEQYDDIKCINSIYENNDDGDERVNMRPSPEKGTHATIIIDWTFYSKVTRSFVFYICMGYNRFMLKIILLWHKVGLCLHGHLLSTIQTLLIDSDLSESQYIFVFLIQSTHLLFL